MVFGISKLKKVTRSEGGKKRCKTGIDYTNRTWKINGEDINIKDKDTIMYYEQDLKNPSTPNKSKIRINISYFSVPILHY